MELSLTRWRQTPFSVVGVLEGAGIQIFTLEDRWRDNQKEKSCIPEGRYRCVPHGWEANTQVRFPRVWRLLKVPDRDAILIHAGNTHMDTLGCILVGLDMQIIVGEARLMRSRDAVEWMRKNIGPKEFWLTVNWGG